MSSQKDLSSLSLSETVTKLKQVKHVNIPINLIRASETSDKERVDSEYRDTEENETREY